MNIKKKIEEYCKIYKCEEGDNICSHDISSAINYGYKLAIEVLNTIGRDSAEVPFPMMSAQFLEKMRNEGYLNEDSNNN